MSQILADPAILKSIREELVGRQAEIYELHRKGLPPAQVSAKIASTLDWAIGRLFDLSLDKLDDTKATAVRSQLALVCLGSHARRQCSTHSDIDLMILFKGTTRQEVANILRPLTQGVFDIGLQLGPSIRTASEAIQLAGGDSVICTSLIEARFLVGNQALFEEFRAGFERMVSRNSKNLSKAFLESRAQERDQFGESVYLLEPNIKKSRGALRDVHLLRWLSFAEFGKASPDELHLMGAMSKFDHHRLVSATDFLLRLRNEMHFHAGSALDTLSRAQQLRIAELFEYPQRQGLLPVEQFMRDYFRHSNHVWQMIRRREASLLSASTVSRIYDPLFGKNIDGDFRIGLKNISATPAGLVKLKTNIADVLRITQLSAEHKKPLDQATYSAILLASPDFTDEISLEVRRQFYDLLGESETVGSRLTLLHELGYLEKFVPAVKHARHLLQFNQYHKYTVDEHSLRAVAEAASFQEQEGTLGRAYQEIADKRILHLALLLHDLGKGFEEDHCDVGKRLAEETAALFGLDEQSSESVSWLVHKHLLMAHLAFRRDTSDIRCLEGFAHQVGSTELLRMLYVLTCADFAAVGPDVLTAWKRDVLAGIYLHATNFLENEDSTDFRSQLTSQSAAVLKLMTHEERGDSWFASQLESLPTNYVASAEPRKTLEVLRRLRKMENSPADAWCEFNANTRTIECNVSVSDGLGRGVFSSVAGALSGEGLEILEADINWLQGNLLFARYTVVDSLNLQPATAERMLHLASKMLAALDQSEPPRFRRVFNKEKEDESKKLSLMSNEVRLNNALSEEYTVVEVVTFDRTGLLYHLARKLHELGMVIRRARIATYLDQVIDVFYLTDRQGQKITDAGTLEHLKSELFQVIETS